MRYRTFGFAGFVVTLAAAALTGCADKGSVSIDGNENRIVIRAPGGYDTLSVATDHCKSYKKKAIYAGRGEGRGGIVITHFNCMLR